MSEFSIETVAEIGDKDDLIAYIGRTCPIDEVYPPEVIKKYCDELSPEDVFSKDKLEEWAWTHGFESK